MKAHVKKGLGIENKLLSIFPHLFFFYLLLLAAVMRSFLFGIICFVAGLLLIKNRYRSKRFLEIVRDEFFNLMQTIRNTTVSIGTSSKIFLLQNKVIIYLLVIYILIMISIIMWGLPNNAHPFMYHMDEWHQMNSIRELFSKGTSNVPGAANGPVFQFFFSGLYLIPFTIIGIIHPFSITSSLSQISEQEKLFIVLRLQTLLFGVFSILIISIIAKRIFRIAPLIPAFLFTINPLWLSLSNYFKYDIALLFWILCSLFFMLRFLTTKSKETFYIACIFSGITTATKISALPLLVILPIIYFMIYHKEHLFILFKGLSLFFFVLLFFGFPDLLFHRGNYVEFFQSNLISNPPLTANYLLGMPYPIYLLINQWPVMFGYSLTILGISGAILLLVNVFHKGPFKKDLLEEKMLLFGFGVFLISLIPLKLFSSGNRSLVLLPFLSLFGAFVVTSMLNKATGFVKILYGLSISILILLQIMTSYQWIAIKWQADPRAEASDWIKNNIPKGEKIGVENVPIYQMIPDVLLTSFYEKESKSNYPLYNVIPVDEHTDVFPPYMIISNVENGSFQKNSSEEKLMQKLSGKYVTQTIITPDLTQFWKYDALSFSLPNMVPMPTSILILKQKGYKES